MPIPTGDQTNAALWKQWNILKKQWGAEGVRMKLALSGGDPNGFFNPQDQSITLNWQRIQESARAQNKDPALWARKVLRHELAHWQQEKVDTNQTAVQHGGHFPRINQAIGGSGSRGSEFDPSYPELPAPLSFPPGRNGWRGTTFGG